MFNTKFVYGTKQYIKIEQKINRTFVDSQYFFSIPTKLLHRQHFCKVHFGSFALTMERRALASIFYGKNLRILTFSLLTILQKKFIKFCNMQQSRTQTAPPTHTPKAGE
jgi:hypothetical protein